MGYESDSFFNENNTDDEQIYTEEVVKDLRRKINSLKKEIKENEERKEKLESRVERLSKSTRYQSEEIVRINKWGKYGTPKQYVESSLKDLNYDINDLEAILKDKNKELDSLINQIDSIIKGENTTSGYEVQSDYIDSYEMEMNKRVEEHSKSLGYVEETSKQVSQQIKGMKKGLDEDALNKAKRRGSRRYKKSTSLKQVYKPKPKPKEFAIDEVTGDVYDVNTGDVYDSDVEIVGQADYDSQGRFIGLTAVEKTLTPTNINLDKTLKFLDRAPGREIYKEKAKYSTMLDIMKAPEEANPLLDDEDKVKAEHQERARAEYSQLIQEIVLERGELYKVLNKYSSELDEEIKEFIENKIAGLTYLEKELGLLMQRHGDSPLREEETEGSLRAVKNAYAEAGYVTQIGEGVGQAVHHLDGYNWFTGGRIDPSNLILLSNEIHDEFHDIYGKGNNSLEQFYEFLSNYYPQELPKFESFMKGAKNIDEKLFDASPDWDNDTWRKQFNRWMSIPWISDIHDVDADIKYDKIPYSSFFLRNMEVPIDGTYKDTNGNEHDRAQLNTSSYTALDIYDTVAEQEMEKWKNTDKKDLDVLRHILHSRQITESINGMLKEEDVVDVGKMKHWSKEKLLAELGESQTRGRLFLQSRRINDLPFLGVDFDEVSGEDNPFSGTGLGSGFLPVMDKLKKFFDQYSDHFDFDKNPLEGWDSNGDMSSNSANVQILRKLFEDDDFLEILKRHIIKNLPIKDTSGISTAHDPVKAKISRFNQEYYADPDDPEKKAFREARADISYLIGISKGGASIDTIGRFLAPKRTVTVGADEVEAYEEKGFYVIGKNKDGQVRLARDYARKPLKADDSRNTWGKAPKPTADKVTVGADEVEAYEARGYRVVGEKGAKIVLAKDVYGDYPDNHSIGYSHPYRGVEIREGSGEEDDGWELRDEGFSRYDYGFDVDESILYPKPPSCCEQMLAKLGEINETINKVGESIAEALKNFKGGFRGSIYDENGMLNGGGNGSSFAERKPTETFYRGYHKRVEELENLLETSEDKEVREFAEKALPFAKRMDEKGLYKSEWNQDLVYAMFGEYPKREKLSLEEEDELRAELKKVKDKIATSITQDQLDKKRKEINDEIRKIENDGTIDGTYKKSKISELELEKRGLESRLIGDDKLQLYKYKEEALKKVLYKPSSTEYYSTHISDYIKGIEGVRGYNELGTRSRFLETRGRLHEMGIDVTEEEENASRKISRIISSYRKELKGDIKESERDEIQEKIDKLKELKSLLDNEGDIFSTKKYYDAWSEQAMPIKGSTSFSQRIHHAGKFLDDPLAEDLFEERVEYLEKTIQSADDMLNGEYEWRKSKGITSSKYTEDWLKKSLEKSSSEYKQEYQELIREPSSYSNKPSMSELVGERSTNLMGLYTELKTKILSMQETDISADTKVPEATKEVYDELLERISKVVLEMNKLGRNEEFTDYDWLAKMNMELGDVALSIDQVIQKKKELESSLKSVGERNQLGMDALFGDKKAQKQLFGEEWIQETYSPPKTEKEPLHGRLTNMAYNFRQATASINQFSGALTKLFAIVGSGNAINDMITASSLRQTNQIMLASRRGMEEAEKLYARIQMLVVKLPGNDTFLTNILTMLGTMDETLSAEDLEYMGGVIADYYMGAQAKGQFNNETERELRNYLMTGQTRNLTNSIIASEVESLKNLNSVKERTIALEKALQATGMDSIAHYDSYTNSLEEFKGRFQKSFADLGDTYLGFLQLGMKVYNFLDNLTGSRLSQFTIITAVALMGSLAFIAVMAELLSISASLIEAFDVMNNLIVDNDKAYSGMAQTLRKVIAWFGYKTGVINADTASQVVNTDATIRGVIVEELYVKVLKQGIYERLRSIATTIRDTAMRYANAFATYKEADAMGRLILVTMEGNEYRRIGTLFKYKDILASKLTTLNHWIETKAVRANTRAYLANSGARLTNYLTKKLNMNMPEDIEERNKLGMDALFGDEEAQETLFNKRKDGEGFFSALIRIGIPKLKNGLKDIAGKSISLLKNIGKAVSGFLESPLGKVVARVGTIIALIVLAVRYIGQLFGWWSSFREMFQAIGTGIRRTWDAFMNSEPVKEITTAFKNFAYTIGAFFNLIKSIGGGIWELLFGVGDGKPFDIVGVFLEIVGAIGKVLYFISPFKVLVEILNAIGSTVAWLLDTWNEFIDSDEMQGLIKDFQEIRETIGEAWSILSEAFAEVKEAFMSIFEDDEELENTKESVNWLLEVLKAIATLIRITIVPVLKVVAGIIKGIAMVIKTVADIFSGFIGFFTNFGDYVGNFMDTITGMVDYAVRELASIPSRVFTAMADGVTGGLYSSVTHTIDWILGKDNTSNLTNTKQLAQNYSYKANNASHVVNNNFHEGSVQADARNMTAKDVRTLFTNAFGYNDARGVNGVIN